MNTEGYENNPMSLHRYLYAYQNPMKYVDPDGRIAALANGADALGGFNEWLEEQNGSFSDSYAGKGLSIANGVARGVASLGEGFLRTANYGANWASVATGGYGVDEWAQAHDQEINATHESVKSTYDYFANQDGFSKTGQQLQSFGTDLAQGKNSALSDLASFGTGLIGGAGAGTTAAQNTAKLAQQTAYVVREGTTKLTASVATNVKQIAQKVRGQSGVSNKLGNVNTAPAKSIYGNDIVSDLGESHAASFSYANFGDIDSGLYYQIQRQGQERLGSYFLPVKPVDSLDAEIMTNIMTWGNNADKITTVRINPGLQAWQGGIQGGTGQQLMIPFRNHNQFIETIDVEPLFKPAMQTKTSNWYTE
jgi:hypothetical protein